MKRLISFLAILIVVFNGHAVSIASGNHPTERNIGSGIENGWYEATVKYSNYKTGTYATYTLNVKVEYGSVTKIDFGNGGSVHTGYNSEGYLYTGGYLSYKRNINGDIVAATTTVSISDTNGMRNFEIRIE